MGHPPLPAPGSPARKQAPQGNRDRRDDRRRGAHLRTDLVGRHPPTPRPRDRVANPTPTFDPLRPFKPAKDNTGVGGAMSAWRGLAAEAVATRYPSLVAYGVLLTANRADTPAQ